MLIKSYIHCNHNTDQRRLMPAVRALRKPSAQESKHALVNRRSAGFRACIVGLVHICSIEPAERVYCCRFDIRFCRYAWLHT